MPSDIGSQVISIKFGDGVLSPGVNKLANGIIPTGIYSGGLLTKKTNSVVTVAPFICEIQSSTTPYDQVRAQTTVDVDVSGVSSTYTYIVARWTYTGSAADDYMEILAVSSPSTYDIVLGRAVYVGATMQTTFDYTTRGMSVGSVYDSGWFAVTKGLSYTKTHNLGSTGLSAIVWFAPDDGGSPNLDSITQQNSVDTGGGHNPDYSCCININTTQAIVLTGSNGVSFRFSIGGVDIRYVSGWYRLIIQKLVNT